MKLISQIKHRLSHARSALAEAERLRLRLALGALANMLYIVWNLILSAIYRDVILLAVSVYYIFLALMRYVLLKAEKSCTDRADVGRASLTVGRLLITADAAFGAVMIYTLAFEAKKIYSPISIIPQSLFLLYCLIGAIVRIACRRTEPSQTRLAADVIALAAAFFSVFNFINYLAHMGFRRFDRSLTLAVGCVALFVIFVAALRLIASGTQVK